MGFPILVRCHLYIESSPWSFMKMISITCAISVLLNDRKCKYSLSLLNQIQHAVHLFLHLHAETSTSTGKMRISSLSSRLVLIRMKAVWLLSTRPTKLARITGFVSNGGISYKIDCNMFRSKLNENNVDGLMELRRNSTVNVLELRLSCINPSMLF